VRVGLQCWTLRFFARTQAMGLSLVRAASSVRFSLSKLTTPEDVDYAIWQVSEVVEELRTASCIPRQERKTPIPQVV